MQSNRGEPCSSKLTHDLKERDVPASTMQTAHLTHCLSSQATFHNNTGPRRRGGTKSQRKEKSRQNARYQIDPTPLPGHRLCHRNGFTEYKPGGRSGGKGAREDRGGRRERSYPICPVPEAPVSPPLSRFHRNFRCASRVQRCIQASDAEGGRREKWPGRGSERD